MNIKFDKEADVIYLQFTDYPVKESDEEKPGMIIDYDENGNIVGIEVLEASKKKRENPEVWYTKLSKASYVNLREMLE